MTPNTPMTELSEKVDEMLIGLWNDANDDDCPLDYCTNRDDAMKWLNARLATASEARQTGSAEP